MKSIKRVFYTLVLVLTFVFPAASALGKTMKETVIQAVLTNPDVQAAWHAFRAAQAEQEAARGGYLPKVDVAVSAGWENLGGKAYRNRDQHNYFREGAYLTLSQMIYDGGMTRSQAKKFGYAKNAKYYDLLSSIEKVALLAFRSHDDVNRYREMIRLAQLNLKRHEEIMKKVEARSRAGIDSSADIDIVTGRIALARVNLITEEGNLHDASTQYFRTVGVMPDETLQPGELAAFSLPETPEEALHLGLEASPRKNSVLQSVQSTYFAFEEQRAKMRPRIDIRAGVNIENDTDGTDGRKDKSMVELVLRYNVFDGGTNEATARRLLSLYEQSKAILEKTEREVGQALLVAYNDIHSLEKQLEPLEQHWKSSEATERAYRQQFEVGRRSLLDLLDAQNEAFQAKRAYVNARFGYIGAKASFLHESGALTSLFGITRDDVPTAKELGIKPVLETPK